MSIQQNFPSTRPSLNLNFARSQKLDPRITFTRTSSATRVNSDGLIEVVPANSPRFDFDPISGESLGLLVEEQRTNLWNNSNDFTVWTKQTSGAGSVGIAVTNATVSPDGTSNAYRYFAQESGSTFYSIYRGVAGISSNTTYTYSAFMKAGEISTPSLVVFDNTPGSASFVNFNLSNGTINSIFSNATTTISSASSITNYGNGWYRCSAVWSSTVSGNGFQFKIDLGGALSQNQGMFVYGAQLEQGSFPTSYIPTSGTTATRTADNASITGSNFSDFYNPNEFTLLVSAKRDFITSTLVSFPNLVRLNEGTVLANNTIPIYTASNSNVITNFSITSGGISYTDYTQRFFTIGKMFKVIQSLKRNSSIFGTDGVMTTTDTSVEMPVGIDRMFIGFDGGAGQRWGGTIQQLVYYPTALPSNQLITLTK